MKADRIEDVDFRFRRRSLYRERLGVTTVDTAVTLAIDPGMTFMDTAWEYGQGRRHQVILVTKVCRRDAKTGQEQLHQSLRRLKTDVFGAWRFHEIKCDNDAKLIFRAGGYRSRSGRP